MAWLAAACAGPALHPAPNDAALAAARLASPSGARLFNQRCASCHGELGNAPFAPPVMGPAARLLRPGRSSPVELRRYLEANMPPDPDSRAAIDAAGYAALTEYLLHVAGAPAPPTSTREPAPQHGEGTPGGPSKQGAPARPSGTAGP